MHKAYIRSARDGVTLTLSERVPEGPSSNADTFLVSIKFRDAEAQMRVSSYMAKDLDSYFQDLAANWRGWSGERTWGSLEEEFSLSATSDRTGHTTLRVFLRAPYTGLHWEFRGALELEAGQLEVIASEVTEFWSGNAT